MHHEISSRRRVLEALISPGEMYFGSNRLERGFLSTNMINKAAKSSAGTRRLRELRANGIKIEKKIFVFKILDGGEKRVLHCYKLSTNPVDINLETCGVSKQ